MALVPAGAFEMGSHTGEPDEAPAHTVHVDAFLIDRCEVTQAQFEALMHKNPSHFQQPNHPVEQVTWADAAFYCNARSRADGLTPCYDEETGACDFDADGYRLPTEAEWECACRAGSEASYCFGDDVARLGDYAWFGENAGKKTHPVATRKPNAFGIHDMHGNVLEWCNDVFEKGYYAESPERNPRGPADDDPAADFVLRGGAWDMSADTLRSAYRAGDTPGQIDGCFRRDQIGFRCVRKPPADAR
ncbi:MAG TPA: SUMF1/EgtB/PvdO family nonheme iron enzyme [Candidatus Hydrogenedentes bacterium]|nr:SUMF1/EgtB/PvdO family nonheme iron enzyme [Candidatus Hydrogenedentota bacterium]